VTATQHRGGVIAPARPVVIVARTEAELAAVRELRLRVFGDEQGMVDASVTDPDDARSLHALAVVADGRARLPVATGRLTLGYGAQGEALIAWVATLPAYRRGGLGTAVIRFLLAAADAAGAPVVVLSAQAHAIPFYRRLGFSPFGHRFHVRGIEHQWMGRPRPGRAG
jgi:predicted GNAT family N-acyltransferase